jgi:serine/threonine protein kinase
MLTDTEKRLASLAVARYGADRARVEAAVQSVLDAHAQGQVAELLDVLIEQNLLSDGQVQEIRSSLDKTQVDPSSPKNNFPVPGTEKSPASNGQPLAASDPSGKEPRTLGEYHILRRLGEGGMGAVYLGYHETEDRQVAIKVLPEHLAANQATLDRFYREAKSGALLSHPNIVRNITIGQDTATGMHYLVLEFVSGPSAQALLEQFGKLSVGDATHIVLDIARALEHAHSRNIVHRDIKPANILITNTGVAKLADLGLAKRTDEASHLTAARQGFGTPYYMPYEQAMNARHADARSDIYALGATLYHLLTGEVPFPGVNHLEIVDKKNLGFFPLASSRDEKIPAVLDQIIEKMLARDPRDRYQTASELIVDLERSGVCAPVPSFVDRDLALQDPIVRQRLIAPAQPTSPDLEVQKGTEEHAEAVADIWYLRYRDRNGQLCKARAVFEQIVKRVECGKLRTDLEVSRKPQGDFVPLMTVAEFKKILHGKCKKAGPKAKPRKAEPESQPLPAGKLDLFWPWGILGVFGTAVVFGVGYVIYRVLTRS